VTSEEPLLAYIRRHLDAAGRLSDDGLDLPDTKPVGSNELRWAPGALDGVLGHHGHPGDHERHAKDVAELVLKASAQPTGRRLRTLHEALVDQNALNIVDHLIDELIHLGPDIDGVRHVGHWLASTSPSRDPVKIGLALLGATGLGGHVEVIRTLGAHDEFTLYAAIALKNGLSEPDPELWALAASVDGWGRIECVHRLRGTQDPQIKSWLLREGYKNSIMAEYTAFVAADTGGLLAALEQEPVDRALLTTAGELISALIAGGPAQDIDDYAEGADTIERYLILMRSRAETLDDYRAVAAIRDFVDDEQRWEDHRQGWSASRREAFHAVSVEILGQHRWHDRVTTVLTSETEDGVFDAALVVARDLGIDTFEVNLRRLDEDPLGSVWFDAWQDADTDRARRLAALAQARLPLAEIASGPANALGLGPEFTAHRALDWTLQALRDHPGVGGDLLLVGLQSPVTRNRNLALRALGLRPMQSWPSGARDLIEATAATDPDDKTRETAAQVLRGESAD
jgi:hypothetical protein